MPRFASREEYLAWRASQGNPGPADVAPSESAAPAGSPVAAAAAPPLQLEMAKPKKGFGAAFTDLPAWAWVFVIGCIAIPVVTLGGAVPGALGLGGAAACANLSKRAGWGTGVRVLACSAVAGGAWFVFLAFAVGVAILQK